MSHAEALPGVTVLETDRLVLRRWLSSDATMHRRLWLDRDPRVPARRRISPDGHPTVTEIEDWIRRDDTSAPLGLLVAVRKHTGDVVGYCGLIANVHGQESEPELAYEFLREQWGQGLATEAAHAVVDWATSLGYPRLWATIRDWNLASQRVAIKLGFGQTSRVERDSEHGDSWFYVKELESESCAVRGAANTWRFESR